MDEVTVGEAMSEQFHVRTPEGEQTQRLVEGLMMTAFKRAAQTHLLRRLHRAARTMDDLRLRSPEGRALGEVRRMHRLRLQLARAGVASSVLTASGQLGIAITYRGITHRCTTPEAIDATLTMIAKGGAA